MQTFFEKDQLADLDFKRSNEILRACVHCGFCTATCPTYQVLGDELDSPRGRIYLIKEMLESGRKPDKKTVTHIDRCLSCLACMTTCPSGVHYMHLVDHAREYIEDNYKRPLDERFLRWLLSRVLPYPMRFRIALILAKIAKPFSWLIPDARLKAMIKMAPQKIPPISLNDDPQSFFPDNLNKMRVALMTGCAQRALDTDINDATIRVLNRFGCEVVIAEGQGCCGSLSHHMGKKNDAKSAALKNLNAWYSELSKGRLDAVIINTSGCGTTVKDYPHMFKGTEHEEKAKIIASLTKDISEILAELELPVLEEKQTHVVYHSACSLQHGQQISNFPKDILRRCGYQISEPKDSHLCCGSAGTYNLLQPKISDELKNRKVQSLEAKKPDIIAAGNIGCMMQIASSTNTPVVHTVELVDWATGGPKPTKLNGRL
ncbi:MAG: glycolate oxidase iron-sulfur subunit [Rhodobacteraceae bacterium]|nr:glycolate oxidase iron-sulfur subunit [Paracoccaceae bacterium]